MNDDIDSWGSGARPATRDEVLKMLTAEGADQQQLFAAARTARRASGMDGVRLRGVIEISNYCQKSCEYCAIRPQNRSTRRYRMTADNIVDIAREVAAVGIGMVFLQSGQDPKSDAAVFDAIPRIRDMGVGVLLNLGEKSEETYHRYAALGTGAYILKFETSDPALYARVCDGILADRLQCAAWIREAGMQLGTGNIVGLPGQTITHLVDDILLAQELRPDFVSASPFIPNEHTPLEGEPCGSLDLTLNTMAIYRLLLPHALIPAVSALERIRPEGQRAGLDAGANVLTVNFTPRGFREQYAIYSQNRFVVSLGHAERTIASAGLTEHTARRARPSAYASGDGVPTDSAVPHSHSSF
jgi:biotin synthase